MASSGGRGGTSDATARDAPAHTTLRAARGEIVLRFSVWFSALTVSYTLCVWRCGSRLSFGQLVDRAVTFSHKSFVVQNFRERMCVRLDQCLIATLAMRHDNFTLLQPTCSLPLLPRTQNLSPSPP